MDYSRLSEWISTTDLLFLAGLLLAVMAMMRMARLRSSRPPQEFKRVIDREQMLAQFKAPVESPAEAKASIADSAVPDSRMSEMLHRLDNRVRTLEALLRAADRKIVELNALLNQAHPPRREPRPSQAAEERTIQPTTAHHQAESLSRARDLTQTAAAGGSGDSRRTAARYQTVYSLLDQGQSAAAVARQLGYPVGEVELIAGLRG